MVSESMALLQNNVHTNVSFTQFLFTNTQTDVKGTNIHNSSLRHTIQISQIASLYPLPIQSYPQFCDFHWSPAGLKHIPACYCISYYKPTPSKHANKTLPKNIDIY